MKEIIKDIIDKQQNLFIYDNSLKYYNYYGKILKSKGYQIKLINLNNPLLSDGWNPMDYLYHLYNESEKNRLIDMIEDFANKLYVHDNPKNDPYWIHNSRQMIIGSTLLLLQEYENEKFKKPLDLYSLESVISAAKIKSGTANILKNQINKLNRKDIIRRLLSPIVDAPTETRLSILSVVEQKLNMYLYREDLADSMKNATFKVEDINENKTAIFVVGKKSLNTLVNILLGQVVVESIKKKYKTNFIIDSFDTLPVIENFSDLFNIINENNLNIYLHTEDHDYINNNYKEVNLNNNIVKNNQLEVTEKYKIKELEIKELESFDYPVFCIKKLLY